MRGWDLQDARGVEVATYADLYGECTTPILQIGQTPTNNDRVLANSDTMAFV